MINYENDDFHNSNGIGILQDYDSWHERSWNSCELKLFDYENFRGTQTRILRKKKRIRRGHTKYSLQNLGRCCWQIYRLVIDFFKSKLNKFEDLKKITL